MRHYPVEIEVMGPIRYSWSQIMRCGSALLDLDKMGHLAKLPQDGFNPMYSLVTFAVHPNVTQLHRSICEIFDSLYVGNPFTRQGPTLEEITQQVDAINDIKEGEVEWWMAGVPRWRWVVETFNVDPIHRSAMGVCLPEGSPTWQRTPTLDRIALAWDIYDSEVVFKHPLVVRDNYGMETHVGILSLVFYLP